MTKFGPERSGNAPQIFLNGKALTFQDVFLQLCGLKFLVSHLCEAPDLIADLVEALLFFLNQGV